MKDDSQKCHGDLSNHLKYEPENSKALKECWVHSRSLGIKEDRLILQNTREPYCYADS